jgi:hypothetical protein
MLFGEIIAVYSEKCTGDLNLLCGDNVEIFNITAGTCSYHCTLKNEVKDFKSINFARHKTQ